MFKSSSWFSRFMNMLADILFVGILWTICSLPLVTAGTAATAAYYTMAKCVRHKEGYVFKEFFHSFKVNFRHMFPLTLIFWFLIAVLAVDLVIAWNNESKIVDAMFMIFLFLTWLVSGHAAFACPLMSRFDKTKLGLIKMAGVCMFKFLPVTLAVQILFVASCIGIYLMPWAILVIPGVCMFVISLPMEWALRKLMPPVQADSEEAQKWYYQ